MVSRQTHFYCCRWIAGVPWGSWVVINDKDCNISEPKHCNSTIWARHSDMEGDKNHKMTSVKERNRSFKKRKIKWDFGKIIRLKSNNWQKIWAFLEFKKNRGGRWYKSFILCICNLDSNISLVACFISSVLLIHFFLLHFIFAAESKNPYLWDIKREACLNNWFQHCLTRSTLMMYHLQNWRDCVYLFFCISKYND